MNFNNSKIKNTKRRFYQGRITYKKLKEVLTKEVARLTDLAKEENQTEQSGQDFLDEVVAESITTY